MLIMYILIYVVNKMRERECVTPTYELLPLDCCCLFNILKHYKIQEGYLRFVVVDDIPVEWQGL